jgi:hypothetical protein
MGVMLILVVVPGVLLNIWLTRRERKRQLPGFEVKLTAGDEPVMKENHGDRG